MRINDEEWGQVGLDILVCPEYFYPHVGGGEVWIWNVARKLSERGHFIRVLTYKHPTRKANESIGGMSIQRMGPFPIRGTQPYLSRALIQAFGILKNALNQQFDVVLAVQTFPLIPSKLISLILRRPIVALFHDVYGLEFSLIEKGLLKGLIRGITEKISLQLHYDLVLAVSRSTRNKLVASGISADKIRVVFGGVDLKFIDGVQGFLSESPLIVYLGRLVKYKHVDDLIVSFRKLLRRFPNAQLWIVGDGPERDGLIKLSRDLRVSERVKFWGRVSDVKKVQILKSAWMLVLPSTKEGLGLVLLESLACKTPVIAVDSGGPRDVVFNGISGFLVPPRDVNALTKRIATLLEDDSLRSRMGQMGRKIVERTFTWDRVTDRVELALKQVLEKVVEG